MKLKKLLKVINYRQPIRIVVVEGKYITTDSVQYWDNYYRPLHPKIAECEVINVRNIHDETQLPDYQNFIEIKIQGGN